MREIAWLFIDVYFNKNVWMRSAKTKLASILCLWLFSERRLMGDKITSHICSFNKVNSIIIYKYINNKNLQQHFIRCWCINLFSTAPNKIENIFFSSLFSITNSPWKEGININGISFISPYKRERERKSPKWQCPSVY